MLRECPSPQEGVGGVVSRNGRKPWRFRQQNIHKRMLEIGDQNNAASLISKEGRPRSSCGHGRYRRSGVRAKQPEDQLENDFHLWARSEERRVGKECR